MMPVKPWIERNFNFDIPAELYPNLLERLRGTPARTEDRVTSLPLALLTTRVNGAWSIQENLGHLCDIEPLMQGRLDDFLSDATQLRAWEETNSATWNANHNAKGVEEILADFRKQRVQLVERFESLKTSDIDRSAFHPRLKKPMRLLDLVYFIAEHDDYHLAKVSSIVLVQKNLSLLQ